VCFLRSNGRRQVSFPSRRTPGRPFISPPAVPLPPACQGGKLLRKGRLLRGIDNTNHGHSPFCRLAAV
jgi:hypothetical protein